MEKPRGIAVIGCGMAGAFHLRAIREIPRARLVGVAVRREDRARELEGREGCPVTVDYQELLRRPDVDLVTVATPSGSHGRIAMEALEAGKHVLVEKPVAMTSAEAGAVIRRASEKGLILSVVSQRRFEEAHRAIRRALDAGALGNLLAVEVSCPFYRPQEYYDQAAWRGTRAEDGGALMNQGIHSVDLMLWFAGPARRVFGRRATRTHRIEAEDLAVALVEFRSGAFGSLLVSTSFRPGFPPILGIYGEKGAVRCEGTSVVRWSVPGIPPPEARGEGEGGGGRDPREISHRYHRLQIEDVLEAIEKGRSPAVTGEDGRRAVELVEAIARSSASGGPVELERE